MAGKDLLTYVLTIERCGVSNAANWSPRMKTPDVQLQVDEAAKALSSKQHVWISGGVGAGKHTTAAALRKRVPDARVVEFVDLTHGDGVAGSILQVAASLPEKSDREQIVDAMAEPERAGPHIVRALDQLAAPLVVLLPSSWMPGAAMSDEDHIQRRARTLIRLLGRIPRVVWIVDAMVKPEDLGLPFALCIPLSPHKVSFPTEFEGWGGYSGAAERVAGLAVDAEASPLVWRLAVGGVALGVEPTRISAAIHAPAAASLAWLCKALNEKLLANQPLRAAVWRALLPRVPLSRDELLAVTQVPDEHAALITECIGYGDPVRVSETLRARLAGPAMEERAHLEDAHLGLASHFEKQDGVADPRSVAGVDKMSAWVEKVHHLGRAGAAGVDRWVKLEMPSPDFYWDRARFLSIDLKDYTGAAEVYRRCVEKFSADDYAHHYLAWNLEHARGEWNEVRAHYAEAVRHNPTNPWWNSRLVCALIRQGRYLEAETAWREALDRVDPDGTVTARSPWLACHFIGGLRKSGLKRVRGVRACSYCRPSLHGCENEQGRTAIRGIGAGTSRDRRERANRLSVVANWKRR